MENSGLTEIFSKLKNNLLFTISDKT